MIAKDILPSPPLKEFVQHYRLRHFVFSGGIIPTVKPFPPRPEQCLTFYIRGHETALYTNNQTAFKKPRSVLSGQFTSRVDRYVSSPEILMIIIDFKPGALHRLTGLPFKELTNKDLDAEDIFSSEIRKLNDRLSGLKSYNEMIRNIEVFLISLAENLKKEFLAIDRLLSITAKDPDCSISWMARHAHLSLRQLERKFDERIGISPKTFLRIARFNQSYWMHLKNPQLSWMQIAMCCGYTDYQHLAKEYREFSSTNPIKFFLEESRAPGRLLGLTK